MLELLFAIRSAQRAFRKTRQVSKALPTDKLQEVLRNGMAYAWEIGAGQPMAEVLSTSAGNPFLHLDWRNNVIPGQEGIDF